MINFTDRAKATITKIIAGAGDDCAGIRVRAHKVGRHTCQYQLHLVRTADTDPKDVVSDQGGFKAFVDPETVPLIQGARVDYIDDDTGSGFQIENPTTKPVWTEPVAQKIQKVIDEQLGPALAQHGGWIELVEVEGDCAHVQLGGGCQGCAGARATLKNGIESVITREVPEVKRVVDDTDHGAGADPYHGH
jgi:Fe/S biogenesis protein NfuA